MDLVSLLERLEETLVQSTKVPLTNKVLLDPDEMLAIVDEMREVLPQEIRDANRVAREREGIISEAREEAESVVREAQALAGKLVTEAAVTKDAQSQADELIDQAKRVAREIRQNALQWADDLFSRVQPDLERIAAESQKAAGTVRKAREELSQQL